MTLSSSTVTAIASEVARYPHKKTALLPALKLAQKEQGWLSKQTLAEVADLIGLPHSHAVELATFYSMLFTEQVAPVRVEFCIQLPCALVGAERALDKTAALLDIKIEGRHGTRHGHTPDHKIELHGTVECYGSCHRAPMCRIGDEYVENLKTDADLQNLVDDLKKRAAAPKPAAPIAKPTAPMSAKPTAPMTATPTAPMTATAAAAATTTTAATSTPRENSGPNKRAENSGANKRPENSGPNKRAENSGPNKKAGKPGPKR